MNETLITGDGSVTIFKADLNESYHSRHGALTESRHVFIEAGFKGGVYQIWIKAQYSGNRIWYRTEYITNVTGVPKTSDGSLVHRD